MRVAVVIPVYGGAWCLERAVKSCWSQSYPPIEIRVVDDASPDDTPEVVRRLAAKDPRIHYHALSQNRGHLAAIRVGLGHCNSDWIALLDVDDELIGDSLERRVRAAETYHARTGEWPGLVYGDLFRNQIDDGSRQCFKQIAGRDFEYLTRELSLCQTSTILLGRAAAARLTASDNPYNTDDEIVLAVGREFAVLHAGGPVALVHDHPRPTRMTNDIRRRLRGVRQLVRDHRRDIVRHHGANRLFLWRLRVLRVILEWQQEWAERRRHHRYARFAGALHSRLTAYLQSRFEQLYF